ncbi:MAB_1171c family putative transporter [Nocardia farcinica]|uniref:MAB_1171c family putative transporter n=1 Tax=Nocardia farcinica TaxID=37329 RepID=UPI001895EF9D|nr:MAB_1171c family putative transporter [Nocardia farcinica]MBF6376873.1 hypothetical protein [Nocardia farcinica]
MTSPIPGLLAWPVLFAVTAITAGRWWLLGDKVVDRLINRALLAAIAGLLMREAWAEDLAARLVWFVGDAEMVQLCRQASFGAILVSVSYIYGIAKLWDGADPADTWRRQRVYDLVALSASAVILIAGTPARRADQLIDEALGWPAVIAWVAFYLPLGITAWVIARISFRELRSDAFLRERVLYLGVLVLAAGLGLSSLAIPFQTGFAVVQNQPSADPDMSSKGWTFFLANVVASAAVAVPLVSTILIRTGHDRTSRYCRRLQPVWRDLTASVPEIVLAPPGDGGGVEPALRLHRMIVEIRDALLHLKPYTTARYPAGPDREGMLSYAVAILAAIDQKNAGRAPQDEHSPGLQPVRLGPRDLTTDLNELLDLAGVWPTARHIASIETPLSTRCATPSTSRSTM